jgi:hypothetical protein
MTYNKKPTMMEMKNVVSNIIKSIDDLYKYMQSLDMTLTHYIDFKKDRNKFDKSIKKMMEDNKLNEKKKNKES